MNTYLPLFLLLLAFISFKSSANQPFKTLVAPIKKDTSTSLYTLTLNTNEHYLIDINSPFLWFICQHQHPHYLVPCSSLYCIQGQSYLSPLCPSSNNSFKNGHCACMVTPVNPVTKSCASSQLTMKDISIFWTNGGNPTRNVNFHRLYASCAPVSLLKSLPKHVIGVLGLSRAPLSLIAQFNNSSFGVTKEFAICLPSTNGARGVMFFGDGPYYLMPPTQFDAASILSYTSLIRKGKSPDFYIVVNGIAINEKASINFGLGSVVKLSTSIPYTTLRSDIYNVFVKDFALAMSNIPRVNKITPFEVCYNASSIGFSRVGFHVPQIDLELGNGKNWTIFGANSMKQIGNDFACLAFIDGGKAAKEAVVIGSYQMEDNFLLFDLANSRFGFSSSLLFFRTTCGSFNFTLDA